MTDMGSNFAKLIRASRGPVLLITLGALLAIHQFTGFSFEQTFPVLIIVFGMMWLLERMAPRRLDSAGVSGPGPAFAPPMQRPAIDLEPPSYDPLREVHRRVYGDPAGKSAASPSPVAAPAKPGMDPRDLPTAEHPSRIQYPPPRQGPPESNQPKGGTLL
jgi:hypothetical protein